MRNDLISFIGDLADDKSFEIKVSVPSLLLNLKANIKAKGIV